jgi:photosystem II stability/assembly factor-like uncharacterized protein
MKQWLWFLALAVGAAHATPVGDALQRPALAVQRPQSAVLLGAAMAGSRIVAVGERGIVALSDDRGARWQQAQVPVSVTLTAVRFADAHHGYAVGHGGVVLTTTDGGAHWRRVLDGLRIAQLALKAAEASGDAARQKEAQRLQAEGADKPLLDLAVIDERRAIVVGAYGLMLSTDDSGSSWTPWMDRLDNPKGLHLYAVRRNGDKLLVGGEQGLVLLSTDAGRSFRRVTVPYAGSFFTAEFAGPQDIVLGGLRGNLWRSGDAGASWQQVPVTMPVSITASARTSDGALLFANQAGSVLSLRDGVAAVLPGPALPPLNGLLPLEANGLLALSVQGAIAVPPAGGAR